MFHPILYHVNYYNLYIYSGTWYEFGTGTTHAGPTNLTTQGVALDHTPVFVRPGGIIPLGLFLWHMFGLHSTVPP